MTSPRSDTGLMIAFGGGLLLLAALGVLWSRSKGPPDDVLATLPRVPEPGVLGTGTPSLTAGVSVWTIAPEDAPAFVRALLATVARHHPVLLAAPATVRSPSVFGGPVYRTETVAPAPLVDLVEALAREVPGVCLFLVCDDASAHLTELSPDTAGVIVATAPVTGRPVVRCRRDGDAWIVEGERSIVVREGRFGLEPVETAA
jgi:hypothetical protein